MHKAIDQSKQFWSGLSTKQRAALIGGAAVTIAVLLIFARLIADPDYKVLATGLESADVHALTAQLASKNIPSQVGSDGKSLSVPADRLNLARMEIASHNMLGSGRLGFELFDKVSWGQTEFDEKVNYQRALEGELERTIQTLHDVESARVHLVMPTESIFLDRERVAKASVILKLRRGSLSDETQLAIGRLVAGAVDNLSPENVAVIDADTNRPLRVLRRGLSAGGTIEQELTQRITTTLQPVVGPQAVRATVNVEYDASTSEESEEKYDPNTVVALNTQRSEEEVGAEATTGGVPGTTSNVPAAKASVKPMAKTNTDDNNFQRSKMENATYAVNKLVRHTVNPAGRVHRITAALLVDDAVEPVQQNGKTTSTYRKRTSEELKQFENLAANAIGLDVKRGDTITVQNISFQRTADEVLLAPTRLQKVRTTLNDWSMLTRYGALLLLFLLAYLLMLRPIKRHTITTLKDLKAQRESANTQLAAAQNQQVLPTQQRAALMKEQFVERIKAEPSSASRLIQNLLREGRA